MLLFDDVPHSVITVSITITASKSVEQIITVSPDGTIQATHNPKNESGSEDKSLIYLGEFCHDATITNAVKNIDKLYRGKCYVVRRLSSTEGCVKLYHKPCP